MRLYVARQCRCPTGETHAGKQLSLRQTPLSYAPYAEANCAQQDAKSRRQAVQNYRDGEGFAPACVAASLALEQERETQASDGESGGGPFDGRRSHQSEYAVRVELPRFNSHPFFSATPVSREGLLVEELHAIAFSSRRGGCRSCLSPRHHGRQSRRRRLPVIPLVTLRRRAVQVAPVLECGAAGCCREGYEHEQQFHGAMQPDLRTAVNASPLRARSLRVRGRGYPPSPPRHPLSRAEQRSRRARWSWALRQRLRDSFQRQSNPISGAGR